MSERNQKYSNKEIIAALREARGLISVAADNLHCERQTIYARAQKVPAVQRAITDARERLKDDAESKLGKFIDSSELTQPVLGAVTFVLRYLGQDRGYVERTEITGKDGGDIKVTVIELQVAETELAEWRKKQTEMLLSGQSVALTQRTS